MEIAHDDNTVKNNQTSHPAKKTCWGKFVNWFRHKDKGKWLEDMRGMLSLVSTMISSITFQASINPPGGVFQASDNTTVTELQKCTTNTSIPCAGAAILPLLYPERYHYFQVCNTFCFVASLSVTLLLASGVPLNHTFPIWILSIGMILTLSSLALTYFYAMELICPGDEESWIRTREIVRYSIFIWLGFVGIVTGILTIRFLVWLVRKCIKVLKFLVWLVRKCIKVLKFLVWLVRKCIECL